MSSTASWERIPVWCEAVVRRLRLLVHRLGPFVRQVRFFLRHAAVAPIRLYRLFLSPVLPPSCRFSPTCSAYAIEAVQTHGVFRGGWLALRRIVRCNPWCHGGYDPVPPPSADSR